MCVCTPGPKRSVTVGGAAHCAEPVIAIDQYFIADILRRNIEADGFVTVYPVVSDAAKV